MSLSYIIAVCRGITQIAAPPDQEERSLINMRTRLDIEAFESKSRAVSPPVLIVLARSRIKCKKASSRSASRWYLITVAMDTNGSSEAGRRKIKNKWNSGVNLKRERRQSQIYIWRLCVHCFHVHFYLQFLFSLHSVLLKNAKRSKANAFVNKQNVLRHSRSERRAKGKTKHVSEMQIARRLRSRRAPQQHRDGHLNYAHSKGDGEKSAFQRGENKGSRK